MNELGSSWIATRLGEVCRVVRGITFPASAKQAAQDPSNICCLRTTNIQREINWNDIYFVPREYVKRDDQFIQVGDILMSMANSYELVGKVALVRQMSHPATFGAFLAAIRPLKYIQGQYLFHLIRTDRVQSDLRKGSSQTVNIANISIKALSEIEIPLAPFNEQKRVADKLDTLLVRVDACREHLGRVPILLKRFRQMVLNAAMSGKLTKDWREKNPQIAKGKLIADKLRLAHTAAGGHKAGNAAPPTEDVHDLNIKMFPRGWELLQLKEVVEPTRPITYGILKPGPDLKMGVLYVRVADFPNDQLNLEAIRRTSPAIDKEFSRSRLKEGDILLSIRGTVGRLIVIPPELEGANITQDSARLSIQSHANRDYVLWFLRSEIAQKRMKRAEKGVAVRGINIGDVRALQIAIPSIEEQHEIVRRVELLFAYADRLGTRYRAARGHVEHLMPALLAKAFRGELVPQDPNDEPASVLLERIRVERLASIETPREKRGSKPKMKKKDRNKQATAEQIDIAEVLQTAERELSSDELLIAAGYPGDADSESIEEFLVAVRDALKNKKITRVRRNDEDWFSVANQ